MPCNGTIYGPSQALVFFQWMNFALAAAPLGRPPLLINMDETSVVRHTSGLVGTIVKYPAGMMRAGDPGSLGDRRSCITFMASITHDTAIQPKLPQILIGNKHQFTAQVMRLAQTLPKNIHLYKQQSAWNNHACMRRYISLLGKSLGDAVRQRYVILLLDVHRSHIDQSILKRCGIRLCYVPASMTGDLQPCDTHLFWKFKSAFRDCWRRCKATRIGGSVTTCEWIEVVVAAIQQVLPANQWRSAFEATGIVANQSGLSLSLMRKLCWTDVPAVPHGPPENHINECVLMSIHMCCGNPKVRAQKEANQMCLKLQGSRSHCHHGDDGCPLPSKGFQSL